MFDIEASSLDDERFHKAFCSLQVNLRKLYWNANAYHEGTKQVFSSKNFDSRLGICGLAAENWSQRLALKALMRTWPKYSGDEIFPVPCTGACKRIPEFWYHYSRIEGVKWGYRWFGVRRHKAMAAFRANVYKWNLNTEYGQLRMDLLEFLIQEVEDVLAGHHGQQWEQIAKGNRK